MVFFRELEQKLEQKNYNLYTNTKTVNSQSNLEKEKPELDELSSLSPDYTTKLVVKAIQYCNIDQNCNIDQWNKDTKPTDKLKHVWAPYF